MPTGSALAGTGDALFDHPAAEISVDQPATGTRDGLGKTAILDPLLPREAREPFWF
jgi:hypothetical protein